MSNRIRNAQVFDARTGEYPVYMYIHWIIGGELDLMPIISAGMSGGMKSSRHS